ncbi:MAG: DUF481 domain-containing protein [Burkholderiaceae bacterium]
MTQLHPSLTLAISLALLAMAHPAAAQGVSVTDYDQATSAYEQAYFNGALNASKNRGDAQAGYDANISVDYDNVVSSPDQDLRYRAKAIGSVGRAGTAGATSTDSYSIGAGITADNYFQPNSTGPFWYGGLDFQANDTFNNRQVTGIVGAGYGRVKNVTPMAKAIRIVEELTARGQLTGTPPLSVYQKVANIIDREPEYRSKYGAKDYRETWIDDIAKEFKASGVTTENFGAAQVLKIYDILVNERISVRKVGWKVRAGVGYVFRSFSGDTNSDPALELGAEYHYPLSNLTQFSNEAKMTKIFDGSGSLGFRNAMTLTHEIDSRLDWENSWVLNYDKNGITDTNVTTTTLSTALYYSLTNVLDVGATISIANVSGDTTVANPSGTDKALFLGVRYRLK